MKSFKDMLDETVNPPKSPDEKRFKDKHTVDKKEHPVATETQFTSDKKKDASKKASYKPGEDEAVYEEDGKMIECPDCNEMYEQGTDHECKDMSEMSEAAPKISKGTAKGSIAAKGIRGKGMKKFDVDVAIRNGKFEFRITDESGRFQTVDIKKAARMLGEEVVDELVEAEMTDAQMKKREEIVKSMKKKMSEFKDRYGDRAKDVMYATATKMAMQEENLHEDVIGDLQKIVKTKSMKRIKLKDGTQPRVDLTTASALTQVYDKLNDANKKKFADMMSKDETNFMKAIDFAFSGGKK